MSARIAGLLLLAVVLIGPIPFYDFEQRAPTLAAKDIDMDSARACEKAAFHVYFNAVLDTNLTELGSPHQIIELRRLKEQYCLRSAQCSVDSPLYRVGTCPAPSFHRASISVRTSYFCV